MSLVRLNIKGISYSQTQSGAYALILSEVDGERKLPIVIGAFEASEQRATQYGVTGDGLPNETINNIGATAIPTSAYGYDEGSSIISYIRIIT